MPANHPFAGENTLGDEVLLGLPMVSCDSYSIPSRAANLQNYFTKRLPADQTYVCDNMQVLLMLVRSGYGCSILPRISQIGPDLVCIPISGHPPLSYGFFYKDETVNPLLKKMISIVKEISMTQS
ncbi:MAG: LysR family transcriptional regulator substrate-binding protein [Clostridiales bacterium]|nr:LysR family transcriptional regulator substrate-binding protein [Clostridiales bacterium]